MHWKMLESAMHRMKLEGEDPNLFGPSNRRREARVPLTFPIEVSGFDLRGRFFTEQSSCFDVGEASCAFRLHAEVEEDAVVAIRSFHWQNNNVLDSRPVLFQVVRIENEKAEETAGERPGEKLGEKLGEKPHKKAEDKRGEKPGEQPGERPRDKIDEKIDESGESIVAVVRLEPAQPRRNRGTQNIERAVS